MLLLLKDLTNKFGKIKSESIVIYQYLGKSTWPGCLHETHRLQYPVIDFKDDDKNNDEYCREKAFECIGQSTKDNQYSITDERIILFPLQINRIFMFIAGV